MNFGPQVKTNFTLENNGFVAVDIIAYSLGDYVSGCSEGSYFTP